MGTWLGLAGTVIFGMLNVWQWYLSRLRKAKWDARRGHLMGIRLQLQQIRMMCAESAEREAIIKTPVQKQWVAQLGHQLLSIEHHLDQLMLSSFDGPSTHPSVKGGS